MYLLVTVIAANYKYNSHPSFNFLHLIDEIIASCSDATSTIRILSVLFETTRKHLLLSMQIINTMFTQKSFTVFMSTLRLRAH